MRAFILHHSVSQASNPKSPIACCGIISAIAYTWELEPLIRRLTPLFEGWWLDLASCINTVIFKTEGGRVCVNYRNRLFFPLPNPTKATCSNPFKWVYDDDIHMETDEDDPQSQGGNVIGSKGGVGSSRAQAVPAKGERYDPPLTRSHTEMGSLGFNEAHFCQYMDDHFSYLNLRLDIIVEHQQKCAQDQQDLRSDVKEDIIGLARLFKEEG
ncbi:hypothetical protein Cgig2_014173 [Carnegiea gigantea]|uniref:Uncharacterized protein n=1 Tax=Carnegiea gigantea TaxID=171969 RepID=A0A9Q1QDT1_9CARY|nr:hypothetical protein Cgig2_014173 [Carnegiea gigantea]